MLVSYVVVMVLAAVIGLFISAVILRAAVAVSNKIVNGEIPEPSLVKAGFAVLVVSLVTFATNFAIGLLFGSMSAGMQGEAAGVTAVAQVVSLPAGFLVMAGLMKAMLPTNFARGTLVTTMTYLITALFFGFAGLVFFAGSTLIFPS